MPLLSQNPSYVQQFKSNRLNKGSWGPHTPETDRLMFNPKAFGPQNRN